MQWYALLLLQLIIIFITSKYVMHTLFHTFKKYLKSTSVSFYILSILYLPGTALHELSHLITSVILFVTPHKISLIPEISESEHGYHVKMGQVHHAQTDPIRGMIIGSAPIFFGFGFFAFINEFNLFPNASVWINILLIYLFCSISSSMFSSRQDMKESIIVVPLLILVISILRAKNIDIGTYALSDRSIEFIKNLNLYIVAATITNLTLSIFLRITRQFI